MRSALYMCLIALMASVSGCADAQPEQATRARVASSPMICKPAQTSEQTFKVIKALEPHCAGCHNQGLRGYFQSVQAFESLLVADARMVKAGDPDNSELIRLLEGSGTGAFTQMPIGERSYAQLAQEDPTMMPMSELRAWISGLSGQGQRDTRPLAQAATVRRLHGEQLRAALYQQLGLSDADFYREAQNYEIEMVSAINDDRYPLRSPEALPAPFDRESSERFFALGGGSAISQSPADEGISPTAVLTLTQVSQAWCRLALKKPDNSALPVTGGAMSADPASVKATISRWSLLFWGELMTQTEVDALFSEVFEPLSKEAVEPAYVGVCSYFIRHPRWLYY